MQGSNPVHGAELLLSNRTREAAFTSTLLADAFACDFPAATNRVQLRQPVYDDPAASQPRQRH